MLRGKKLYEARLKAIKEVYPDKEIKTSKKGNLYVIISASEGNELIYTPYSVTKNTLSKLGTLSGFKVRRYCDMIVLGDKGKLLYKTSRTGFTAIVGHSRAYREHSELLKIGTVGTKVEWIKNYPNLALYRLPFNFSSLKEFKVFLGYNFISDSEFYVLVNDNNFEILIQSKFYTHESRVNIIALLDKLQSQMLHDTVKMLRSTGRTDEIPEGKEKLKLLHDVLVFESNKKDIESYSNVEVDVSKHKDVIDELKSNGIEFEVLDSPRKLAEVGYAQFHCLASYTHRLDTDLFLSFPYEGETYQAQIYNGQRINQFLGYHNKQCPNLLRTKVQSVMEKFKKVEKYQNVEQVQPIPF